MDDILGIFNFKNFLKSDDVPSFFKNDYFFSKETELNKIDFSCGCIFYTERKERKKIYSHFADKINFFIFGTVFAKDSQRIKQIDIKKLSSEGLRELYRLFKLEMVKFIKGNFVIIISDDEKKELILISSKLNALPLFYCYREGHFIFSSSVKAILSVLSSKPKLNETSFVEYLLFFYPLGNKTYFDEIFQLLPGSILKFDRSGLRTERYFSLEKIFNINNFLSEEEALEECIKVMKSNIDLYTKEETKFLLSLTGGFDGRLNLALLDRDPKDFLCYSYGLPGSKQIEIPLKISEKLGLNYNPVYLNKEFEERYEEYALKAIEFSDGTAPILRANFPYAFEKLSDFSKINITGLFGSEIIKPFYMANQQVSEETIDLFMDDYFDRSFVNALSKIKKAYYINSGIIDRCAEEIRENFYKNYIWMWKSYNKTTKFYLFLLEESIRKYFMNEIRIERYYVETRVPYFDEDFLEIIFKTPFAGIYKGAMNKNPFFRRKSQEFYAKIIKETKPILGGIITDRGYRPKDLLTPSIMKIFIVGPPYLKERLNRYIKGNDTFKSVQWSKNLVERYIDKIGNEDHFFTDRLKKDFKEKRSLENNCRFYSIFSLRLWLFLNNLF